MSPSSATSSSSSSSSTTTSTTRKSTTRKTTKETVPGTASTMAEDRRASIDDGVSVATTDDPTAVLVTTVAVANDNVDVDVDVEKEDVDVDVEDVTTTQLVATGTTDAHHHHPHQAQDHPDHHRPDPDHHHPDHDHHDHPDHDHPDHDHDARASTPRAVAHKMSKVTKHVVHTTHVKVLQSHQSLSNQVETSIWCFPIRLVFISFPRYWPRSAAIVFGVLIPLWILIGLSFGFGILLSRYESPTEILSNDEILAARAYLEYSTTGRIDGRTMGSGSNNTNATLVRLRNATRICLEQSLESAASLWGNGNDGDQDALLEYILEGLDTITSDGNSSNGNGNSSSSPGGSSSSSNNTTTTIPPPEDGDWLDSFLNCTQQTFLLPELEEIREATTNNSLAFESLSFQWNRCWPYQQKEGEEQSQPPPPPTTTPSSSEDDEFTTDTTMTATTANDTSIMFIFHPTPSQIVAARPENQELYYEERWKQDQQRLFQQYWDDHYPDKLQVGQSSNRTTRTASASSSLSQEEEQEDLEDEQSLFLLEYEAFVYSIQHATGGTSCTENTGGTAWFFFTIMTTVGYGNQAPVTDSGRLLIVTAGLASLILFAAVLGLCGYVLLAIFDDVVERLPYSSNCAIGNPAVGMVLWGTIWLLYALTVATDVEYWWQERMPDFAADVDRADALWFAFISTSTIGLGDYFLQPEVIFASDTLKYSVLYMVGFVFLSTFLGKIAETLAMLLPEKHNSLEARLKATRVLACWPHGWMPWEKWTPWDKQHHQIQDPGSKVGVDNMNHHPNTVPPIDYTEKQNQQLLVSPDDQALVYRLEQVKALKPDPPSMEDEEHDDDVAANGDDGGGSRRFLPRQRSIISSLKGNPIHSMNVDLLAQEESLLLEWLDVVQRQKQRAMLRRRQVHRPHEPEPTEEGIATMMTAEATAAAAANRQVGVEETGTSSRGGGVAGGLVARDGSSSKEPTHGMVNRTTVNGEDNRGRGTASSEAPTTAPGDPSISTTTGSSLSSSSSKDRPSAFAGTTAATATSNTTIDSGRADRPPPALLHHDDGVSQDTDNHVVTPAEEIFNPLARFLGSA